MKFALLVMLSLPMSTFASSYTAVKIADCQGTELVEVRIESQDSDRTVTETIHYEVLRGEENVKTTHVVHQDIEEYHFAMSGIESMISKSYEFNRIRGWDMQFRMNGQLCRKL